MGQLFNRLYQRQDVNLEISLDYEHELKTAQLPISVQLYPAETERLRQRPQHNEKLPERCPPTMPERGHGHWGNSLFVPRSRAHQGCNMKDPGKVQTR